MLKQLPAWTVIAILVGSLMVMGWTHFHQNRFGVFVIICFALVAATLVLIRFITLNHKNH